MVEKVTELRIYCSYTCHTLYDYMVDGKILGQFEVQFDDGKFNGVVLYTDIESEDENGEFDWNEVRDKKLYDFVKERVIRDYDN